MTASANEIAAAVERMLQTDVLVVENEQGVFSTMKNSAFDIKLSHFSWTKTSDRLTAVTAT